MPEANEAPTEREDAGRTGKASSAMEAGTNQEGPAAQPEGKRVTTSFPLTTICQCIDSTH